MGIDCDKPNGLDQGLRAGVHPEPKPKIAVLIYENVDKDIHTIEYLCRQFDFEYHLAKTESEALAIMETRPIKVAVVNYALEKIKIRTGISVVATGDPNASASMQIIGYFPVSFIPKPLTFSAVSLGLVKAARIWNDSRTYPSHLVNSMTVLAELQVKLKALTEDPEHQWTIEQSLTRFCEEDCCHAKTGSQVSPN